MQAIDQINHMDLIYFAGSLSLIFIILVTMFVRQLLQMRDIQRLSSKLDELVDEMAKVDPGDYKLKTQLFNNVRKKYHEKH